MPSNPSSILDSVKKVLGLDSDYTEFDLDVVMHINGALSILLQLGAGPATGLMIDDNTTLWSDLTTQPGLLGLCKSFIYLQVQFTFDPPTNRYGIEAKEKMLEESKWRINVEAEKPVVIVTPAKWYDLTGLSDFPTAAADGTPGYDKSTWNIYVKNQVVDAPYLWDMTGLSDFPTDAETGDLGYDTVSGNVWSNS